MFNNCTEAIEWITSLRNEKLGFDHFKEFITNHNTEVNDLKFIHIAGTNGKGSTCNMLCDCLLEEGYKVGTFTSPHFINHRDRICIDHEWISEDDFLNILNSRIDLYKQYHLNMFQIDFDIMTIYFTKMKVDYVILEVGLGGRLDSTNVIKAPLASVIVSIGLDHMELLGDTEEKIAFEKAGIIKDNSLVICGKMKPSVKEVIQKVADQKNAKFINVEENEIINIDPIRFKYCDELYELSSRALYQIDNASVVIETLNQCKSRGLISISFDSIKKGIYRSHWAGRFDIVSHDPLVILDGAHNEHGIKALIQSIECCPHPRTLIFSALKDKEFDKMITELRSHVDRMIITEFDFYRAFKIDQIDHYTNIEYKKDYKHLIREEIAITKDGCLIICGSLYFISEVNQSINQGSFLENIRSK